MEVVSANGNGALQAATNAQARLQKYTRPIPNTILSHAYKINVGFSLPAVKHIELPRDTEKTQNPN